MNEIRSLTVTMKSIALIVAEEFDLSLSQLQSKIRSRTIVRPRQIAMYLIRKYFGEKESYPNIGSMFGGKDHSTVIHACRNIENLMNQDEAVKRVVDVLWFRVSGEKPDPDFVDEGPADKPEVAAEPVRVFSFEIDDADKTMVFSFGETEVRKVVAAYYAVDPCAIYSTSNDDYIKFCWRVYAFIVEFLHDHRSDSYSVREVGIELTNRIRHLADLGMRSDVQKIWSTLQGKSAILV
jgi:hypothetical protein